MLVYGDGESLSRNIRFLRNRKKMSRNRFSKYVNIRPTQLYCIETRTINYIDLTALVNICEMYGLTMDEVMTENLEQKYADKRFYYRNSTDSTDLTGVLVASEINWKLRAKNSR